MGPRAAELVGSGLPTAQDGRDSSWRPLPTAGAAIPQPGLTCRWHCCTSARAAGTSSAPNGPKSHGSRRCGPGSLWRPRRSLQTDRRDFFSRCFQLFQTDFAQSDSRLRLGFPVRRIGSAFPVNCFETCSVYIHFFKSALPCGMSCIKVVRCFFRELGLASLVLELRLSGAAECFSAISAISGIQLPWEVQGVLVARQESASNGVCAVLSPAFTPFRHRAAEDVTGCYFSPWRNSTTRLVSSAFSCQMPFCQAAPLLLSVS